ncbi:MAG: GDSL-like Lipase/Acylhydrolase [Actinomycetia bacterium]|nr:GDSL-like Lipase/Acylhydrolase [Actinomycetes bacterium]
MGTTIVACLGDSITAGSPLWDPDPDVRARIGENLEERSQWQWWASQLDGMLDFRNHGVYGQRTDEIAARLDHAAAGADVLVVQGGINDVVQKRPVEEAARNLAGMVERGRRLGLAVALVDVLPWNNGDGRAANDIARLNTLIAALADGLGVPLLPFHDTLADPERPQRMRDEWTDDGDHPSVEGHRLLGERAFRLP